MFEINDLNSKNNLFIDDFMKLTVRFFSARSYHMIVLIVLIDSIVSIVLISFFFIQCSTFDNEKVRSVERT